MNWQIIVGIIFLIGGIGNITSNIGAFFFGTIVGAALLYWGIRKKKGKSAINSSRELQTETFRVVGVNYHLDSIHKLACSNPDWKCTAPQIISKGKAGERIFRYNFINKPVKLIPEPDNEHDKNAVAVYIAGELVGYISRDDNRHVLDILNKGDIKYISGFIGGGEYKVIHENKEISKFEDNISIKVKIGHVK